MKRTVVLFSGTAAGPSHTKWNPLSILSVGTALRAAGFDALLLDPQIHDDWPQQLQALLPGALFLGATCLTGPSINNVLQAISICRSSYGCPYACTYCSEPFASNRRWKPLAPSRVVREIAVLWDRYNPERISFMDPNFSTSPRRVVEIVEEMENRGISVEIMCNMRARDIVMISNLINISRLRAVGFAKIFLGVESGSDHMLTVLKKAASVQDSLRACGCLDEAGIHSYTSFMHELPGETETESTQTIKLSRMLAKLPTNRQLHHFFTPFPSTELYSQVFDSEPARTQSDWARSDTYHGNGIWSGRVEFRRRVVERLDALRASYPSAFQHQAALEV
jgi:anaerobic magnesium-protoporphyrin IX monomethyl ester cyclase